MRIEGNWKDLETKGYLVIRDLLPAAVLEDLQGKARATLDAAPANRSMSRAGADAVSLVQPILQTFVGQCHSETAIKVDDFDRDVFFFWGHKNPPRWHTDPIVYYLLQDSYQYVNFWLPIIKPDRERSGLTLLPMDVLAERDRPMFDALHRRGGANLIDDTIARRGAEGLADLITDKAVEGPGPKTLLYEANGELKHLRPAIDADALAVSPPVLPGDAVVARGDVLHRTQDNETERAALSIRALSSSKIVTKEAFLTMSDYKFHRMTVEARPVAALFMGALAFLGRDQMSVGELLAFMQAVSEKREPELAAFEAMSRDVADIVRAERRKA